MVAIMTIQQQASYVSNELDDFSQIPTSVVYTQNILCIGDLHGNALKLLHSLVKHQIIKITAEDYASFYKLYHASPVSQESITQLINLINSFDVQANAPLIRLLGDELADRGQNDFYTLYLLKKLADSGVAYDVNQSNHAIEFALAHQQVILSGDAIDYASMSLGPGQARSLFNLSDIIQQGYVSKEDVAQLVDSHKKHQRIISYSLTDEGISLYSHAPIDYKVIRALANKFSVSYYDESPRLLAYTIEKINQQYLGYVESNLLHTLINQEAMYGVAANIKMINGDRITTENYPLEHILWNRDYLHIKRSPTHPEYGYAMRYIHGHDSNTPTSQKGAHIICLDSLSGKGDEFEQCGFYPTRWGYMEIQNPIYHCHEQRLTAEEITFYDQRSAEFYQEIALAKLNKLCDDYLAHIERRLLKNSVDYALRDKQQLVIQLKSCLIISNNQRSMLNCLRDFQLFFQQHKAILAEHRSELPTWLNAFFRGVKIILFKIFQEEHSYRNKPTFFTQSHGGLMVQQAEQVLSDNIGNSRVT